MGLSLDDDANFHLATATADGPSLRGGAPLRSELAGTEAAAQKKPAGLASCRRSRSAFGTGREPVPERSCYQAQTEVAGKRVNTFSGTEVLYQFVAWLP